ncbi:MAG: CheB methylesterase domain-containing protein, partial [Aureliella sp.]
RSALSEKIFAFREGVAYRRTSGQLVGRRALATSNLAELVPSPDVPCQAVILGTSTGGPEALKCVLPKLPGDLGVPMLVVQHMPPQYTLSLAKRLNDICELEVVEACDGMEAVAGRIIIAAGGKQLKLERSATSLLVRVNQDLPENGVRPAVDYLLRSAMDVLQGQLLAVIMTGMGRDGLVACRHLKQIGGYVFAQNQDDCVVYGMPKAVIDEGLADRTLPLGKIAPAIVRHLKRSRQS